MFEALQNSKLPREHIFACTVGASSKRTKATYHVLEPADVIAAVSSLVKPRTQTINEHR